MSIESEFDLDKLFLPSWAQESPSYNKYAGYAGGEERTDRDDRRGGRRGPRRGPPGEGRGPRPEGRGPRPEGGRGPRPEGQGPRREGGFPRREGFRGPRRDFEPRERREPMPLPELAVTLIPDEAGVESIARQIKMTGRAYPLFEIAKIILAKPERQQVKFDVIKREDKIVQQMFLCMLDDTLWLSEAEAVRHVLDRHFDTFYKAERTPTDPPKGVFTFVAQCGMSGVILGPPNYHDYQNKLRKLHQERFSRMPFEMFKSRVKIVKDEAVVKKWVDDQSWKTEYLTLNVPEAEAVKLQARDDVEAHFRQVHLPNIIKEVESYTISGVAARKLPSGPMQRLVRRAWEQQQRYPLDLVTHLSHEFAQRGLQFFKVNKFVTHVAVARPHYLDLEATPVSDGVRKIVEYITSNPKCSRRNLIEALAPSPAPAAGEGAPPAPASDQPTPEQSTVIADLHWLVHQGHVIEFANGTFETAKKPKPRPEPKKPEPASAPAEGTAEAVPNASVETVAPEVAQMEAARPGEAVEAPAGVPEPVAEPATEPGNVPEFSEAEIADLEKTAEENLANADAPEAPKPAEPQNPGSAS